MKQLKEDLKKNTFKRVYLLFGEERYLVKHYAHAFSVQLLDEDGELMNKDIFDGKEILTDRIIDAANTLPYFSHTRLVYVRDSKLFAPGRKDDTEALAGYLPQIPESTIMIFVETDVDKRNRLYKKVVEIGRAVDLKTPSERELIEWVKNVFKKKGKVIDNPTAMQLLKTVSHSMDAVCTEADKVDDYTGSRKEITVPDLEAVCSPSLETRVFDLVAAVGNGQTEKALVSYHHLLIMKEQPIMILTMMTRQFRMILQCKACAEKRMSSAEIAAACDLREFIVSECIKQSRSYTIKQLLDAMKDCNDIDTRIKTGLINGETGVETLIIRYSKKIP